MHGLGVAVCAAFVAQHTAGFGTGVPTSARGRHGGGGARFAEQAGGGVGVEVATDRLDAERVRRGPLPRDRKIAAVESAARVVNRLVGALLAAGHAQERITGASHHAEDEALPASEPAVVEPFVVAATAAGSERPQQRLALPGPLRRLRQRVQERPRQQQQQSGRLLQAQTAVTCASVVDGPAAVLRDYMSMPASQYRFVDSVVITRIGPDTFRFQLPLYDLVGVDLLPSLDVEAAVDAAGRAVRLRSTGCSLYGGTGLAAAAAEAAAAAAEAAAAAAAAAVADANAAAGARNGFRKRTAGRAFGSSNETGVAAEAEAAEKAVSRSRGRRRVRTEYVNVAFTAKVWWEDGAEAALRVGAAAEIPAPAPLALPPLQLAPAANLRKRLASASPAPAVLGLREALRQRRRFSRPGGGGAEKNGDGGMAAASALEGDVGGAPGTLPQSMGVRLRNTTAAAEAGAGTCSILLASNIRVTVLLPQPYGALLPRRLVQRALATVLGAIAGHVLPRFLDLLVDDYCRNRVASSRNSRMGVGRVALRRGTGLRPAQRRGGGGGGRAPPTEGAAGAAAGPAMAAAAATAAERRSGGDEDTEDTEQMAVDRAAGRRGNRGWGGVFRRGGGAKI